MNTLKSHFTFTNKQRNGIFLLLTIIVVLQCVYYCIDFSSEAIPINQKELALFKKEMDSLCMVEIEKRKPKIYPFNPNFITDYKGYRLGMTPLEIDRLLHFRKQDKWVNSAKEFQIVTQISDSLLQTISPYFKFPDWVSNAYSKKTSVEKKPNTNKQIKTFEEKIDLNSATASQLQKIYGVGKAYSKRIINYRDKQKGFIADVQLQEVYGLSSEIVDRIKQEFTVKTPKHVIKLNINTANRDQLVKVPYLDYEITFNIIEQRTLRDGFKSLDELIKVKDFPIHKIDIIKLYLTLD